MTLRAWFSLVPALFLILPVSHAQSTNASIYGTVVDSSGGAINKSAVVATNTKTGVALSTLSNESGVYICHLRPHHRRRRYQSHHRAGRPPQLVKWTVLTGDLL
jgi:hypothetical protein